MQAHVFVAMPFDAKEVKADVIVDFDEVYSTLIAPALQKAGCIPFRADQEEGAGDIRTDMFFELVTADAIIADISILNANVYYELGVRHGVTPRGVFMIHGGWGKPPFDIASDRRFEYNGSLFLPDAKNPPDQWKEKVEAEVARLGEVLRKAFEVDSQTIGSGKFIGVQYATPQTIALTLTVTDSRGATNAITKPVAIVAAPLSPVAAFTVNCGPGPTYTCTLDGSGSKDPDGSIVAYKWTNPLGQTVSTSVTYTRSFPRKGDKGAYTLVVTDNSGLTGGVTQRVVVP